MSDVVAAVTAAFEAYEQALVANRLDELDDAFCDDERLVRFVFGAAEHGATAVRAARRAVERQTTPRTVERLTVNPIGPDAAIAAAECRLADGTLVLQTQVWVRTPDRWRVAGAHVSAHP